MARRLGKRPKKALRMSILQTQPSKVRKRQVMCGSKAVSGDRCPVRLLKTIISRYLLSANNTKTGYIFFGAMHTLRITASGA